MVQLAATDVVFHAAACRGATKKYQFTQPIRPSPATITIQSVADIEASVQRGGSYPTHEA